MRRVVVTGMGLVTPLGADVETTWKNLLAGKSGAGTPIGRDQPVFFAAFNALMSSSTTCEWPSGSTDS